MESLWFHEEIKIPQILGQTLLAITYSLTKNWLEEWEQSIAIGALSKMYKG